MQHSIKVLHQFVDKVYKLKQTERNEAVFEEKRALAYKGKAVEVFLQNPWKYNKKFKYLIKIKRSFE